MERIRILLARMPRMLRDILSNAMAGEADLEIVGHLGEGEPLEAAVERTRPDVVVLGSDEGDDPGGLVELFQLHPRVKVLTVSGNGREAVLHGLRPHADALGEASLPGLLAAIRAAFAPDVR